MPYSTPNYLITLLKCQIEVVIHVLISKHFSISNPSGKGKAKAYGLANIDAEGMTLTVTDIFKRRWKVGKPVGTGGFGRLYQVKLL